MSARRIVSRGRIKVDARRAVAKLREHLLLDPDSWPLEVVRVAAMCGATGVSVEHDADDLRIAFDGKAPPAESIGRLLDFALESSREPGVRSLRLLAIALNAAISTRPSRISVAVQDDETGDARFRFDTTLHRRDDHDASDANANAETLEREPIERDDLRGAAVRVELNKGFSWGTFVRFASQRALREVTLLHEATRRFPLPLTFSPELPATTRERPVMVVSLEKHGVPGGVLEVRASTGTAPRIELLEHGVLLSDVALPASLTIPVEGHGVHLPIDVHVDAESWPTNASRSQVHAREVTRVVEAIHAVLPAIGRDLGRIMQGDESELEGTSVRPTRAQAERAAAAFACCASQSGDGGALAEMLDLPVGRDAVGRPITARHVVALARRAMESAGARRVFVHRGDAALPDAFAPFADDVVWLGGSPVDQILAGVHTRDFADVHREVAAGIARREAWLQELATGPRLEVRATELLRFSFHHRSRELDGLRGEVAIHVGLRERPSVRVFVEDRLLATVAIDGSLPIEAAIAWPGRLKPTLSFDDVARDAHLDAALREVGRAAAEMLAGKASTLGAADAEPALRALGRAALAVDASARRGPLGKAPLWPTAAGGWTSLVGIAEEAKPAPGPPPAPPPRPGASAARLAEKVAQAGRASTSEGGRSSTPEGPRGVGRGRKPGESSTSVAIPFVQHPPKSAGARVPGGRTVLVLDAVDAHRLGEALEAPLVLVPFGPALGRVDEGEYRPVGDALEKICADALAAEGRTHALVVSFREGRVRGLCATATRGRVIQTFAGVALEESVTPDEVPVILVIDDERATPKPSWDGLLAVAAPPVATAVQRLADAVRVIANEIANERSMTANVESLTHRGITGSSRAELCAWALGALGRAGGVGNTKSKLARTLADIPCIEVLDDRGEPFAETASGVRRTHAAASVPYLDAPPEFPTLGWRPVVARSRSEIAAIELALGCPLADATRECERRREIYTLEEIRKRILDQPAKPLEGPLAKAHPLSPTAVSAPADKKAMRALVALRSDGATSASPATLRYCGRDLGEAALGDVPPQLVIVLDTPSAAHIVKWARINNLGREAGLAATHQAAIALAEMLVSRSADLPMETSPLAIPGACELVTALVPQAPTLTTLVRDSSVQVESAFGDVRVPLRTAWCEGPTPVARRSFSAESASSALQVPILLEPRHLPLERLLHACGLALQDITRALTEATGDHSAPAMLQGAPQDPSFRAHFINLGVSDLDGELELVEPNLGGIELLVLGDSVQTASPDLAFAVRAIARPKRIDTRPKAVREIAARIAEAATRLVERLAPSVETLPPLAATAVRACVRQAVEAGEQPRKVLAESPAFMDASARAWSLKQLLGYRVRFTTDDPPYAETARAEGDEPAVFRFDPSFATALRKLGTRGVFDVTNELRLDAEAEARAKAPRVPPAIALAARASCFAVTAVAEDAVRGEVGLLAPGHADDARVFVHLDGRPLCSLGAPEGWPIVAVVDDAALKANRRHDGLAPTSQADAILQRVRRHRDAALDARSAAPTDAWGDFEIRRSLQSLDVFGRLWLGDDDLGRAGNVQVHWAGAGRGVLGLFSVDNLGAGHALALEARDAAPGWVKQLPVSGVLFVTPASPRAPFDGSIRSMLGAVAVDALAKWLERRVGEGEPELARWQWAAALWGAPTMPPPARDTSGKPRKAAEVVRELRRRGALWTSRHGGTADGDFPDEAPAFILLDDGKAPLIDLLEACAPALVRELGHISSTSGPISSTSDISSTPDGSDISSTPDGSQPVRRRRKRRPAAPPDAVEIDVTVEVEGEALSPRAMDAVPTAPTSGAGPISATSSTSEGSWLSRVGTLVADLTRSAPSPHLEPDHPLAVALAAAAARLGRPVPKLAVAPGGRALTYSVRDDTVRIRLDHPAIAPLLERAEVETIAAAAIGEMNRLLTCITDIEEMRVASSLIDQRSMRRREG